MAANPSTLRQVHACECACVRWMLPSDSHSLTCDCNKSCVWNLSPHCLVCLSACVCVWTPQSAYDGSACRMRKYLHHVHRVQQKRPSHRWYELTIFRVHPSNGSRVTRTAFKALRRNHKILIVYRWTLKITKWCHSEGDKHISAKGSWVDFSSSGFTQQTVGLKLYFLSRLWCTAAFLITGNADKSVGFGVWHIFIVLYCIFNPGPL